MQRTSPPLPVTHPLLVVLEALRERGVHVRRVGERLQVRPRDAVSDAEAGVLMRFRSLALAVVHAERPTPSADRSDESSCALLLSLLAAFPEAESVEGAFAAEKLVALAPVRSDGAECVACAGRRFWRLSPDHDWACATCHPPTGPDLVEWRGA